MRRLSAALVLCGMLVLPAPSFAAETPLEAVPANASVVIRLKNPDATTQKLVEYARNVDQQLGVQVQQFSAARGILISNPALAGVDTKRDWWAAVFSSAEADPVTVFLIPTTDAEALQNAVGPNFTYVTYEDWVLYTEDAATAKKLEDHIANPQRSIAQVVGDEARKVMDEGELAAFVNANQLVETYREQLQSAEQNLEQQLETLSQSTVQGGVNLQAVAESYGELLRGLLQAIRDAEGLVLALQVQPKDLLLHSYLNFEPGSASDKFVQKHPTSELNLVSRLPSKKLGYFGLHGDIKSVMKWSSEAGLAAFEGGDDVQKEKLKSIYQGFSELEYGSIAGFFDLGNLAGGAIRVATVMEVTPPDKMRDLYRQMVEVMSNIEFPNVKQTWTLKKEAESFDGRSADVVTVKYEIDPANDPGGMQQALFNALYGPDGMTTRLVTLDKLFVMTVGSDRSLMATTLEALAKDAADAAEAGKAYQATRQKLNEKANIIGMIDLPSLGAKVVQLALESGEVPIPLTQEQIEGLKFEPSYLGISISADAPAVRGRLDIPAQQVKGIYQLVQMFMQQQQPAP